MATFIEYLTTLVVSCVRNFSFLLYRGADIYAKDAAGFTPMMNAILHQHKEVVKTFFEFKYMVDNVVKQGKILLEWAIELGHNIALIKVSGHYMSVYLLSSMHNNIFY